MVHRTYQSGKGASDGGKYLLWCHERCFKEENEARRKAFVQGGQAFGASAVFLKKARQFSQWMDRCPGKHFVLVTDWREAQPSIQAVEEKLGESIPAMTIVMCDSEKQVLRASDWARKQSCEVGPIQVHNRLDLPPAMFANLLSQSFFPDQQIYQGSPTTSLGSIQDIESISIHNESQDMAPGLAWQSTPLASTLLSAQVALKSHSKGTLAFETFQRQSSFHYEQEDPEIGNGIDLHDYLRNPHLFAFNVRLSV